MNRASCRCSAPMRSCDFSKPFRRSKSRAAPGGKPMRQGLRASEVAGLGRGCRRRPWRHSGASAARARRTLSVLSPPSRHPAHVLAARGGRCSVPGPMTIILLINRTTLPAGRRSRRGRADKARDAAHVAPQLRDASIEIQTDIRIIQFCLATTICRRQRATRRSRPIRSAH